MSQPFYRAFEDRYRGSREIIKQRLRAYDAFIAPLAAQAGPSAALDLGCGRGEWLELLGESGFAARGVDLDEGMLAACRERGLDVENRDALAALRAQPDDSLAVVSAFHLVEHIPFDLVQELISEARRALRPGGLLILETPNPENLVVGATSFYRDPSHLHPIPPELLAFAAEHGGFTRQRVLRLQEAADLHEDRPIGIIDVLQGVSPDYSVVAQKAASQALLAPLDEAFAAPRGIDLGVLAQRYEKQLAEQHAGIHHIFADINRHIEHDHAATNRRVQALDAGLHQQLAGMLQRLEHSEHRLGQTEQRLIQSEQRAQEHASHVIALLGSTSWRITAPLRSVSAVILRVRAARRDGRLFSGVKRRTARPVRRLLQAVLRRPALKRAALSVLRYTPRLRARLQAAMYRPDPGAHTLTPQPATPGDLSPRAARIYREFKQALEAEKN